MKRALCSFGVAAVMLLSAPGAARAEPKADLILLGVPTQVARDLLSGTGGWIGLGVFPDSRTSADFLTEMGAGAPWRNGAQRTTGGHPQLVLHYLTTHCIGVDQPPASEEQTKPAGALGRAFPRVLLTKSSRSACADGGRNIKIAFADTLPDAGRLLDQAPKCIVFGDDGRMPLLIGIKDPVMSSGGVLTGGVARRRMVVTPYDLARTIAGMLVPESRSGAPPGFAGNVLEQVNDNSAFAELDALRARMIRDADYGENLSLLTTILALLSVGLAALGLFLRKSAFAKAFARAGVAVPPGYVLGLFIPTSSWAVRAIPLVLFVLLGLLWRADVKRFCIAAFAITSAALTFLTIAAALRPDGEPALSLWGDPLVSSRFFGLRNHLASFLAGGALTAPLLLGVSTPLLVVICVAALVIIGAAFFAANFIAVLTFGFGVSLALFVLIQKRARVWHVPAAAAIATALMSIAFLADASARTSHGGRAASAIGHGGARVAWDLFRQRLLLDYHEVQDFGAIGWIMLTLLIVGLAWIARWAWFQKDVSAYARAAIIGGAAAAFAAIFVEDSGFFTGAILALYPWTTFVIARTRSVVEERL